MALCSFSSDYLMETYTLVDNFFINEYLPFADEKHIKVYLYGLFLCNSNSERLNDLENLSKTLDMSPDEIVNAFQFWADEGLLEIMSIEPLEVLYRSLKGSRQPPKKYKSGKFADFNIAAQQIITSRMIGENEYLAYYETMDEYKIQQDAMLMIIQYCVDNAGAAVRYPYITTVAKDWAKDGVRTVADVDAKLAEYDTLKNDMRSLMSALGRRRTSIDLEEKQMFTKWTKSWGFDLPAILFAAKSCKNKGGFKKLDKTLDEYYRMNIYTSIEMEEYVVNIEKMRKLTIEINRIIGVYYESLDHIIEHYINPWLARGYDEAALLTIAQHCFVSGIKTLSGMNMSVQKFYKLGLVSAASINEYIDRQLQNDEVIKKILLATGTGRSVTNNDREYYRIWCVEWGLPDELILLAAENSAHSRFPMQFMNRQLSHWKELKITDMEGAKKALLSVQNPAAAPAKNVNFTERKYTKEQLNAIFDDIHDIDDVDI